jgi:general secretion pathway protein G
MSSARGKAISSVRPPRGAHRHSLPRSLRGDAGITLLELVAACFILIVLSTMAVQLKRIQVVEWKERLLRDRLQEMRDAIDRYKDDADAGKIQVEAGTEGYPPDLKTLVDGVKLTGAKDMKVRYLRTIESDPVNPDAEGDPNGGWGLRSTQDDPDSTAWGGQDVFDVYSQSTGTALDGTKYSDW